MLKLDDVKIDLEVQKLRPSWEKGEEHNYSLVNETLFVTGKHGILRGAVVFQMRSKPISNQAEVRDGLLRGLLRE